MSHKNDLRSSNLNFMPLCFPLDRTRDKNWKVWVIWIMAALLCLEFSYKYPITLSLTAWLKQQGQSHLHFYSCRGISRVKTIFHNIPY